jgi:hypothetical protein
MFRECVVCHLNLFIDNFSRSKTQKNGYCYSCKACDKKRHDLRRSEFLKRKSINFSIIKKCPKCKQDLPGSEFHATRSNTSGLCNYCKSCKKEENRNLKIQVFESLGGLICINCGEKEFEFLTLQHKLGGGKEHRQSMTWKALLKQVLSDPLKHKKYEVLCANCNHLDSVQRFEFSRKNSVKSQRQRKLEMDQKLLSIKIISATNNPVCACCFFSNFQALCVDHIIPYSSFKFGPRNSNTLNRQIIDGILSVQECKKYLQILCFNCNQSKGIGKLCIHRILRL